MAGYGDISSNKTYAYYLRKKEADRIKHEKMNKEHQKEREIRRRKWLINNYGLTQRDVGYID